LVVFHPPFVTASTAANLFYHGCKKRAAGNEKFFDPTIFQKCWRGVGGQPTFAEQIVFEIGYNYEPQAKKSFLLQQFFKNAGEVWASSPHLRSKLSL